MRHRTFAAALVGFAAVGAITGATGEIGRMVAVHRVSDVLASLPGLSFGRVSAGGGALSIDDLDYRAPRGGRLHIGRLTLPGGTAAFVGSAAADPAGVTATDLSITFKHTLIAIPRIEAQGTYLTADRLKALLDPSTELSLADRLKEITAASLRAPTVTVTAMPSDPDAETDRTTFDDVAFADVVAGRIGSVSIRKAAVFKSAVAGAPSVGTLGPITVSGLDLPLAVRIVQTGRADPAEPPRAVYGSLSVRDIAFAPDDTTTIRIGTIASDGFRGRPLLRRPADVVALIDKSSDSRTPDDIHALADIAVDAAKGFSLDHLEWDDVSFGTTGRQAALFRLGRMVIDGLTPSQIATWILADVAFSSDDVSVTLDRMALHGPDESPLVDILGREFVASGLAMDRTRLMSGVPQDASLSVLGLHIEAPSQDQAGNSAHGRRNLVDLPVVSFASETDATTRVAITTAHAQATYALPTTSENPGFAALARNGFTGLDARADYRMTFDPKGQAIRLDPLTVAAEKLGRISVSADVGSVPFDLLARGLPSSDAQAAFGQMTFKGLTLDLRNDGVVEMALPVLAASADTSVAMLKVGAKTQSDLFIGQTLGATPAAARLMAAIDAFIDDPHNLLIAVTAPAGLTVAEIQAAPDPKSLLDRVGIEAMANR